MIKAFIFDFDGLILDTETACYDAWQEIYAAYGTILPLEKWLLCIGTSDDVCDPLGLLSAATGLDIDQQVVRKTHAQSYRAKTRLLPLKPGILDYLQWARANDIRTAIASSSSRAWVVPHLEETGILPYFDVVRTKDEVKAVKPDPELFLSAKSMLNLADYEAVIFEDSYNGIIAGNLAKLFTVAIPNPMTKNMDLSAADRIISGLDTISPPNLLKMLENGA